MADPTLRVKQTLDNSQFKKGLKDSQKFANSLQNSMKAVGTAIAGAFAVGAIINYSKESMAAYSEQIKSEAKLQTALKGRKDVTDRLVQQANELQKVTLFGDEDIINGQALLATFTQNEQQLKTLTPLVLDYAQAFGMDVASAAKQVGKALVSANGAIGKSGIEAEGAAGSYERYANLVQALTDKFIGQAENAIPEALKAQRELTVSLDEMKESWGGMVTSIANAGLFKWMSEELNYLSWGLNKIKKEGGGFKKWWQWFWSSGDFTEESYAMEQNAIKNAEQLQKNANILQGVSGGFKTYGEMVDASAAANKAAKPVIEKTAEELAKEKKAAEDAAEAYQKYLEETRKTAQGTDVGHMTSQSAGAEMNTGLFLRTGEMQFDLPTNEIKDFDIALKNNFEGLQTWSDSYEKFYVDVAAISDAINETLRNVALTVVDTMATMLEAMVAGEKMDFGATLLSAIGGFMKQLGEAMITIGAIGELFDTAIKSMQWYVALGAGVALVAAGAVLSGVAKKGVGMAEGGIVPGGYPGDTYPAMLSSGEVVVPPGKLDSVIGKGGQTVRVVGQIRGQDIHFVNEKQTSKLNRYR